MNNPKIDGIDHINIYSKGETELGRWLSNFTKEYFMCDDGEFASIEGYWYWLLLEGNPKREQMRNMYGYLAKKIGRQLGAKDWGDTEEFKNKIKTAMQIKLLTNPKMKKEFKYSVLPFTHYYVVNGFVKEVPEGQWILDHWEYLRKTI